MSGKYIEKTINIAPYDFNRLEEKAEEFDTDIATIISWLVEDYLDELEEV